MNGAAKKLGTVHAKHWMTSMSIFWVTLLVLRGTYTTYNTGESSTYEHDTSHCPKTTAPYCCRSSVECCQTISLIPVTSTATLSWISTQRQCLMLILLKHRNFDNSRFYLITLTTINRLSKLCSTKVFQFSHCFTQDPIKKCEDTDKVN
jgi:hypothetical protein